MLSKSFKIPEMKSRVFKKLTLKKIRIKYFLIYNIEDYISNRKIY